MSAKKSKDGSPVPLRVLRGANLAQHLGTKRKGALVRSILVDPGSYNVAQVTGEPLHPLVEMGIGSGGSGGEVRLKLWLTLVLQHNSQDDWIDLDRFTVRMLAGVFGLDEDISKGAEAVRRAYRWLADNNYIEIEGGRLKKSGRVRVTTEAALFLPDRYMKVPRVSPEGKSSEPPYEEFPSYHDSYCRVPLEVWSRGWMGYLRASELMVLIILCKLNENRRSKPIEVFARRRQQRFGLSDSMWSQGAKGLERRGILQSWTPNEHSIDEITLAPRSYRMIFRLNGPTVEDALSRDFDHELNVKIRSQIV